MAPDRIADKVLSHVWGLEARCLGNCDGRTQAMCTYCQSDSVDLVVPTK